MWSLVSPPFHHLANAAISHGSKPTQPQRVSSCGQRMFCPSSQVTTECLTGAIAEWSCTLAPTLAHDEGDVLVSLQMLQLDPDQLGDPQP